MKVLFLTHQCFPRHVGGTEVYTQGLVERLMRAGHQARIITAVEAPVAHRQEFHVERSLCQGVPLLEVHFNLSVTEHPARAEYDNPFPAEAVREELASFAPDVMHVMHAMKLSGAAMMACLDAGFPVVVTLCDFWFLCPRHTLLKPDGSVCTGPDSPGKCVPCVRDLHGFAPLPSESEATRVWMHDVLVIRRRADFLRRVLLRSHRIIALSHFQKRTFVSNGYPAERIEVIEHGLEAEAPVVGGDKGKHEQPRRLKKLGFVGSLVPHKGPHVLLEALREAPELGVECRIHGPLRPGDGYCERLRHLAADDARVRLLGGFAPEELGLVLGALDLLAAPTLWYENDPLVIKAALRMGLPVLASRRGTLEEMVGPRGSEWLVEPDDVSAWTAALRRVAATPLPVFEPVRSKNLDDNAREMLAVYHGVARLRSKPAASPVASGGDR